MTTEKQMKISEKETVYSAESLLASRVLSGYQPDFARAVLTAQGYTIAQARTLLQPYRMRA